MIADTTIAPSVLVKVAHWYLSKSDDPALRWLVQQLRRAAGVVEFGDGPDDLAGGGLA